MTLPHTIFHTIFQNDPELSPCYIELQRADSVIGVIIQSCESAEPVPDGNNCLELQLMLREISRFEIRDSLLYWKRQCDNKTIYQLVLPKTLRNPMLYSLHDEMGHLGAYGLLVHRTRQS